MTQTRLFISSDSVLYRGRWVQSSCWTLNRLKLCAQIVWASLSCPKSLFSVWPVATFFSWINNPPICMLVNYWCMHWDRRPRPRLTCHWCDRLGLVPYSFCVTSISDTWGNHTVLGCCSFTAGQNYKWIVVFPVTLSFPILQLLRKSTMALLQIKHSYYSF